MKLRSCQHLFRSGGVDASHASPPVSAPGSRYYSMGVTMAKAMGLYSSLDIFSKLSKGVTMAKAMGLYSSLDIFSKLSKPNYCLTAARPWTTLMHHTPRLIKFYSPSPLPLKSSPRISKFCLKPDQLLARLQPWPGSPHQPLWFRYLAKTAFPSKR